MNEGTTKGLQSYQCFETVQSAKILEIKKIKSGEEGFKLLVEDGPPKVWVEVSNVWLKYTHAKVGGYCVLYEDGYISYSPADVFEKGYKLLKND